MSFALLIFAEILWPTYTALAVRAVEPDRRRRHALGAIAALGAAVSLYLLIGMVGAPPSAAIRGHSIDYTGEADPLSWQQIPYQIGTGLPLLLSAHRMIRVFGVVVLAGFVDSATVYVVTFVSVWCFFPAAASTLLYFHFRHAALAVRLPQP